MSEARITAPILSIADFLQVQPERFDELEIFNGFVNRDTPLFISPYLLRNYRRGDFGTAFETLCRHFERILSLLSRSHSRNDIAWKAALKALRFEELPEIGLGYSTTGVHGQTISDSEKERFLSGLQKLLYLNVGTPEHIALATLFEDGLGPDRISDLIASCIRKHIIQYTDRMCARLNLPENMLRTFTYRSSGDSYRLPVHPSSNDIPKPLLLLPRGILSEPPVASSPREIYRLYDPGSRDRHLLLRLIMKASRTVNGKRQIHGDDIFQTILSLPVEFRDQIRVRYEQAFSAGFDSYRFLYPYNLGKSLSAVPSHYHTVQTVEDLHQFVNRLCEEVRETSNNDRFMFYPKGKAMNEDEVQTVLQLFFFSSATKADVHFEKAARGAEKPDFIFTRGRLKACIELKLLKPNTKAVDIKKWPAQIQRYVDAHHYQPVVLMIIDMCEKDSPAAERKRETVRSAISDEKVKYLQVSEVDAQLRRPASKENKV